MPKPSEQPADVNTDTVQNSSLVSMNNLNSALIALQETIQSLSVEELDKAIAEFSQLGNDGVPYRNLGVGVKQYLAGSHSTALEHFAAATSAFTGSDAKYWQAFTNHCIGNAHHSSGDFSAALAHQSLAYEQFLETAATQELGIVHLGFVDIYDSLGQVPQALEHAHKALETFVSLSNDLLIGRAQLVLGSVNVTCNDFSSALEHYNRALDCFELVNNRRYIVRALNGLGIVYSWVGSYPESLEVYLRALRIAETLEDQQSIADLHGNIGVLFFQSKNIEEGLKHLTESIAVYEHIEDPKGAALAKANLGTMMLGGENNEDARQHIRQAITVLRGLGCVNEEFGYINNLIMNLFTIGRHEEASSLLHSLNNPPPVFTVPYHTNYALDAASHGRHDLATEHLNKALDLATRTGDRHQEAAVHMRLRDLAQQRNDFEAYIKHNNVSQQIAEEINGRNTAQRLAVLQVESKVENERREREKERALLYATLPKHVADRMISGQKVTSDTFENGAVLFSDIKGFTANTSSMQSTKVVELLDSMFSAFESLGEVYGITKVKTIGDSYMCFKGDLSASENAECIVRLALAMVTTELRWPDGQLIQIRIGVHIGPVTAGVIGTQRLQYDVWGDTVNIASRLETTGVAGRIHASHDIVQAIGEGTLDNCDNNEFTAVLRSPSPLTISITKRGETELKGKGVLHTYWID